MQQSLVAICTSCVIQQTSGNAHPCPALCLDQVMMFIPRLLEGTSATSIP
jgi:hypothetical protein